MVVEKRIKGVAWIYTVDKGEGGKKSQNYFGCHVSMAPSTKELLSLALPLSRFTLMLDVNCRKNN